MKLHHRGFSRPDGEKPHYWNMDDTPTYTLWMMQTGIQDKSIKPRSTGTTLSLIPAKVYTDFKGLAPGKDRSP
jgi:hypothetical protein